MTWTVTVLFPASPPGARNGQRASKGRHKRYYRRGCGIQPGGGMALTLTVILISGNIHRRNRQPNTFPAAAPPAAPASPKIQPPSHPTVADATGGTSATR